MAESPTLVAPTRAGVAYPKRSRARHFVPAIALASTLALALGGCGQTNVQPENNDESGPAATQATNNYDVASYAIGVRVATQMEGQFGDAIDAASMTAGINDAFAGGDLVFDGAAMAGAIDQLVIDAQAAADAAEQEKVDSGVEFLAENGSREGVVTTASGLQYEVMASGDGATPGPTDTVSTHYHGTLIDGTVFDSSVERGMPLQFPVNGVIKGWTEALQLMKVGDKWKLFIPPELAYGERGAGGSIGPNETLIFEVELLAVVDA